jgi:transposase
VNHKKKPLSIAAVAATAGILRRHQPCRARGNARTQKTGGHWRKLNPQTLQSHVKKHPDATLKELQMALGVSHNAIWVRLGQLGLTLKKTRKISGAQRSAATALAARTRKAG